MPDSDLNYFFISGLSNSKYKVIIWSPYIYFMIIAMLWTFTYKIVLNIWNGVLISLFLEKKYLEWRINITIFLERKVIIWCVQTHYKTHTLCGEMFLWRGIRLATYRSCQKGSYTIEQICTRSKKTNQMNSRWLFNVIKIT